jgi:16S rRNA A1518/A1519 N6-dimethyltransferase RsmA/KsgA/DIM1 with predicted DNA glycosylase/AP lyase activity
LVQERKLNFKYNKKKPNKIIVIEKDKILADLLQKKFKSELKIITEDILKIDENILDDRFINSFWKPSL